MSNEHRGSLDSVPQWKRELILRRRAVARFLPAGSASVQLSCPSVVAAVRFPEYSPPSDLHFRTCVSERGEQAVARKNMRLIEQVNASGNFADPGLQPEFKKCSKVENGAKYILDMGEEKTAVKKKLNGQVSPQKKRSEFSVNEDDSLSDSSEELKYGPGIVSKLKSRYLSLTLRECQGRIRPNLPYMRRATSLENILDETDNGEESKPRYVKNVSTTYKGSIPDRCRSITRGNKESMKRAGSVETLLRYDRRKEVQYNRSCGKNTGDEVNEKKLIRHSISSVLEDRELPPPDLVKHTLKIFENSNNITKNFSKCKVSTPTKSLKDGNLVCGKKPTSSPRSPCSKVIKCVSDHGKNASENVIGRNAVEPIKRTEQNETLEQKKSMNNVTGLEKINPVERLARPVPCKDKPNELNYAKSNSSGSSTTTTTTTTTSELPLDNTDGEGRLKVKGTINSPNLLEASDVAPLINNNSKKENVLENDKKLVPPSAADIVNEEIKNLEVVRSLSPVLVKAPPCILSSEVNANSHTQPMKQLGVVRPIVINKTSQQILPIIKCSINKSHSLLTEREIEKNLINSVKSIEQPVTKVIVSLKKSPEECIVPCDFKQNEENKNRLIWDGRKPNTMVFNFSNRKTVPDYIENDGLILAQRKDKPKREPGIIFLGGGTYDSSTDYDAEDFISDPPSPCDFTFEGDNILINGKSNIQSKPKMRKMKIQFNDEATTMFEYPSEASLLDDQQSIGSECGRERNSPSVSAGSGVGLPNPFCSSNLASYTPSKVMLSNDFQLGVTKTSPPPTAPRAEPVEQTDIEEYLRPADENTTVTWSSETAADLLF